MAPFMASSPQSADTYESIPKGVYALKRDFNASTRLTAQHYLWKDALKFNIHPDIPTDNSQIRIADVATGNGFVKTLLLPPSQTLICNPSIWLLDVAREVPPSARLDGFDISLDQCPPSPWLPANTNLHTWDVYKEPPKQFQETFDIVHVRLITVAIKNNDPRPVLANLRKLLKPGGFLQWDEADSVDWTVKNIDTSVATDAVRRLFQQLCGSHDWKRYMVDILNEDGFEDVRLHKVEYDLTMARYWNDVYMSTWDEFAKMIVRKPEESLQLSREAMDQVRDGCAISCPKLVWIAQKAW
ncbi:hypothetical protein BELL_0768g00050 [Botrytis elliptica]|uniref:Methyltransferase domain-containing protein n=1 Tax=Botrytis elliptica TaxID=278938 RepID=A0A4Z1J8L6_9HELO|nr:hypothetical protein BELL_0768g00050 [Botrytis elliptica]